MYELKRCKDIILYVQYQSQKYHKYAFADFVFVRLLRLNSDI